MPLTRITDAVMGGTSVLVTGPGGMAPLLDAAARHLARTRVIRVRPPFELPDFVGQVAVSGAGDGPRPRPDQDDTDVERAFRALTELDAGCDRIALLVEGAHDMPHPTLRYVEMALFTAAHLHVVLAGKPALASTLALEGFARLCNRVPVRVCLPDAAAPVLAHLPARAVLPLTAPALPPSPRQVSRPGVLAILVMTGMAVGVALAVLASRSMQAPHGAAMTSLPEASLSAGPGGADPPAIPAPAATAPAAPPPVSSAGHAGADEPVGPLAAGLAPAAVARPVIPPRVQPRLVPIRPDRVTVERAPAATQDERRCRGIIQHLQLGEDPTDADRAFLRSGCRQ